MTMAEALNILAERELYEQLYGLKRPQFHDLENGRVGVRFDGSGVGMFQTVRELNMYCSALQLQKLKEEAAAAAE